MVYQIKLGMRNKKAKPVIWQAILMLFLSPGAEQKEQSLDSFNTEAWKQFSIPLDHPCGTHYLMHMGVGNKRVKLRKNSLSTKVNFESHEKSR